MTGRVSKPFSVEEAQQILVDFQHGDQNEDVNLLVSLFGKWRPAQHEGMRVLWNGLFDLIEASTVASVSEATVAPCPILVSESENDDTAPRLMTTPGEFKSWFAKTVYKARRSIPYGLNNVFRTQVSNGICVLCRREMVLGPGLILRTHLFRNGYLTMRFRVVNPSVYARLVEFWASDILLGRSASYKQMLAHISGVCGRCPQFCETCNVPVSELFNAPEIASILNTKECLTCQASVLTNCPPPKLIRQQLRQFSKFRKGGIS